MKHVISDKYSIAWFKLAQCIAKGERERAMGIYRLLSHSIENSAYAKQLEADLYLYFQDTESALAKYKQAAAGYKAHQAYIQAIALYEQCLMLQPHDMQVMRELFDLASELHDTEKQLTTAAKLIASACNAQQYEEAQQLFIQILERKPPVQWVTHNAGIILTFHAQQASTELQVAPLISALVDTFTQYDPYDFHKMVEHLAQEVPVYGSLITTMLTR